MKQTVKLGAVSAANILSNILFQWLVLTMLGPGIQSDALFAGMTVPQIFSAVISSSLTHVLVPILAGEQSIDQRRDGWTLFVACGSAFCVVTILLLATASWWVPLTVAGFSAEGKELAVDLARISLLGMVFTGLNSVQWAMAFARYKNIWADAAPMIANMGAVMLLFWALPRFGVRAAAWILVLRLLMQTILLQRVMGAPMRPDFTAAVLQKALRRLAPMLAGASYYKMDPLVDRFLLSSAQSGSLSLLYMAQQIYSAGGQVITKALVVPAITSMSTSYKSGNMAAYRNRLRGATCRIGVVCTAGVFGLLIVGSPLIVVLMGHGKFDSAHTHLLWILLVLMSGQFIGGSFGALTAGAFYSTGDTRTPTVLGSVAFTIGIVLKVVMFKIFGLFGLAIAISIYYLISFAAQFIALCQRRLYCAANSVETKC